MRRADRLFEIIQVLRRAEKPVTAHDLAEQLEVTERTIYRDMAALQGRQVPIEGAAGVGYIMRPGYDLPPLMFTLEEIEAISVGLSMLDRTADCGLRGAASSVIGKIQSVLPLNLEGSLRNSKSRVTNWPVPVVRTSILKKLRDCIRRAKSAKIAYIGSEGQASTRSIKPLALVYHADVIVVAAWCDMREDFRHFRADRIAKYQETETCFAPERDALFAAWEAANAPLAN